jgi:HSP20 family protein
MTPFGTEGMGDVWMDRLWPEHPRWHGVEFVPSFDLYEKDNNYVIKAELPGVKKDDLNISVEGNVVNLSGKKSSEHEEEGGDYYMKESSYGSFSRSIRMPGEVDDEKAEAEFKDGILTLTLPKKEEEKGRRIKIKD